MFPQAFRLHIPSHCCSKPLYTSMAAGLSLSSVTVRLLILYYAVSYSSLALLAYH